MATIMIKAALVSMTCLALTGIAARAAEEKAAGAAPTDPQIAMIAVTADTVDINAGKPGAEKATNPKVCDLCQSMVRDHTSLIEQATASA